jgi:hypothetical protein
MQDYVMFHNNVIKQGIKRGFLEWREDGFLYYFNHKVFDINKCNLSTKDMYK